MDTTQIVVIDVVGIVSVLVILALAVFALRIFIRRIQSGQGPFGSLMQQSHEIGRENVKVARERLLVEQELLAAQKETNELLKQILVKFGKVP